LQGSALGGVLSDGLAAALVLLNCACLRHMEVPLLRSSLRLLTEREVELFQKSPSFVVGRCRRANDDVHAPDLINLVVVDFRKHDVFLDAHGEVATTVKALR